MTLPAALVADAAEELIEDLRLIEDLGLIEDLRLIENLAASAKGGDTNAVSTGVEL
ncbi:MAG: hypothetical protein WB764_08335 [Xanthobacteraceae bacterium]